MPRPPWIAAPKPTTKSWSGDGFYNSVLWRTLRDVKLSINPLCEKCEAKRIIREANVVDHIKQISQGGEALDINNLQSLCVWHHNSKSASESHLNRKRKQPNK